MNLLAPDLRGEILIMIADDWSFRMNLPLVAPEDRLRLVQVLADALQLAAKTTGVTVQMRP